MNSTAEEDQSISKMIQHIADETPVKGLTVAELLMKIGPEGLLIAVVVLTLPFLLPISIPGTSTPFGLLIILICYSLMKSARVFVPKRLGRVRIRRHHMVMIAQRAVAVLKRVENICKPRLAVFTATRPVRNVHMSSMMLSALCLMLPLPLPLSNTIPAYGIVFFSFGLLRRDGAMILLGYGMLAAILTYLALVSVLGVTGVESLLGL